MFSVNKNGNTKLSKVIFFQTGSSILQGRIQTGSKGSHKPVKQFRFLKQNIRINYQIPDYKKEFDFLM